MGYQYKDLRSYDDYLLNCMILAYFFHHLSPFLIELSNGFGIRWYGLSYLLAFLIGLWLYRDLARRGYSDLLPNQVNDFILGGAIVGVLIGGRLGYMIFYDWKGWMQAPASIFYVWEGGMASHGGMLGLMLYTLWYAHRHGVSWRNLNDNLVVVAPIGLFLGRIANFINGELYGHPTTVPWAVYFPKTLYELPGFLQDQLLTQSQALNPQWNQLSQVELGLRDSAPLRALVQPYLEPRHPSQLYEALLEGAVLFGLMWILRTRVRLRNGILTGIFFITYAIFRIGIEYFRQPDAPLIAGWTRGQFLSLFLIGIGLAFLGSTRWRPSWPPRFRG